MVRTINPMIKGPAEELDVSNDMIIALVQQSEANGTLTHSEQRHKIQQLVESMRGRAKAINYAEVEQNEV